MSAYAWWWTHRKAIRAERARYRVEHAANLTAAHARGNR